jgi:alkanesulfonate monooxygenase SsuD/methylene tetrahydromethanopterin reductase-like flavin-dependent oxidoreductase (luciferase family)
MELSLIVRGQHPAGDDMRARLADDIDLVMRAEELGFNALVKGSHYSAHPLQSLQQIPFLAQAAVLAPSLRLVCGLVLLPLHKPLDIAEQLATLDIMCGGKLVFGCGIGYRDVEFKAFGLTRKEAARRFEECLLAVKRLWTEDFVDMAGSHFVLDHANSDHRFDELLDDRFLIGSPAEVAEQLIDLQRRFGVNHLVASLHWPGTPNSLALEQMQILAEEVMPAVRRGA